MHANHRRFQHPRRIRKKCKVFGSATDFREFLSTSRLKSVFLVEHVQHEFLSLHFEGDKMMHRPARSEYVPADEKFADMIQDRGKTVTWLPTESDNEFIEYVQYDPWGGPVEITWIAKEPRSFDAKDDQPNFPRTVFSKLFPKKNPADRNGSVFMKREFTQGQSVSKSEVGTLWDAVDEIDAWSWDGRHECHVMDGTPWRFVLSKNGSLSVFSGNGGFDAKGYAKFLYTLDSVTKGQFDGRSLELPVVAEILIYSHGKRVVKLGKDGFPIVGSVDDNTDLATEELQDQFGKESVSMRRIRSDYTGTQLRWSDDQKALAIIKPILEKHGFWNQTEIRSRYLWEDEPRVIKTQTGDSQ